VAKEKKLNFSKKFKSRNKIVVPIRISSINVIFIIVLGGTVTCFSLPDSDNNSVGTESTTSFPL